MIDINDISSRIVWKNSIGLARAILALATLLTLVFNSALDLFLDGIADCDSFQISIFCVLKDYPALAKGLSIFILLLVVSGWQPKATCIPHWWITYSFANSVATIDGGDHISTILTALLIPVCLTDFRKWHWHIIQQASPSLLFSTRSIIAQTALFVIKIQISFIYLHSAVAKVSVKEWMDGTSLYYWFTHPVFGANNLVKPILSIIIYNDYLSTYLTWSVILFEFILFAGIFMSNRTSKVFLVLGVLFHFSIFIIHGLFTFFLVMTAALILYFRPMSNFKTLSRFLKVKNEKLATN